MAKKDTSGIHIETDDIPENILKEARERAIREKAMLIARRELGLEPAEEVVVAKGPPKDLKEEQFNFTLDLAEHSDRLVIDGTVYFHGGNYTVGQRTYDAMREMISRGWNHQREIEGKNENAYRLQRNVRISPRSMNVSAKELVHGAA